MWRVRPGNVLWSAVLALALLPAGGEARGRSADLTVERVSAGAPVDGRMAVSFSVLNRGDARSRRASVRVTVGRASVRVSQRPLRPGARARHTVRVARVAVGTWPVSVCARPVGERVRRNDCGRAARAVTVGAPAFALPPVGASPAERLAGAPSGSAAAEPGASAGGAPELEPTSTPAAVPTPMPGATEEPEPTSTPAASPTPA